MLLYIYTRSHQSEWMMMMSERVRAVRVRVRAARTSPVQSLAAKPASDPGGDRGVRALADRSLAITATHKFFSVDFQIFSKMTVSDVFQIQIFTHTHTWGGTEPTNPIISLSILVGTFWQAASFRVVEKETLRSLSKCPDSQTCSRFRLPFPILCTPVSHTKRIQVHGCVRHRLRCPLADAQCLQVF